MKSVIFLLLLSVLTRLWAAEQTSEINNRSKPIQAVKMPVPLNYWVHFDAKTANKSLAAYGEFFNVNMDKVLYLTAVENDDFEQVGLHVVDKSGKDYQSTNDLLFILPPMGGSVKLEYGGKYLLLRHPKRVLVDGDETILTLHYRVEGSEEEIIQNVVFLITSNGIGCGVIPPSE